MTGELLGDNVKMQNDLLDLQSRSMRDDIIIHGLSEQTDETKGGSEAYLKSEQTVRSFLMDNLKMERREVDTIRFSRVHCLG